MIPENREQAEQLVWHDYDAGEDAYEDTHCGRWVDVSRNFEDCVQALEAYLKQEADPKVLDNSYVAEGMEKRLAMKAEDWCLKHNRSVYNNDYTGCAREAITRYLNNSVQREHDPNKVGNRLGKSHYMNT